MEEERFAPQEVTRRTFLAYLSGAISAFIGIAAGVPILGYLAAPLATRAETLRVNLGKVEAFKNGEPRLMTFTITRRDGWVEVREARTCWVVPEPGGKFLVFNGRCTHLGCGYSWRATGEHKDRFFCPCHDGLYDRQGTVIGGPPPRPLDRLEATVEGDELVVVFQDFRPGVPGKEPA